MSAVATVEIDVEWDVAFTAFQIAQAAAHAAALSHDTRRNPQEWQAADATYAIGLYGFTITKVQQESRRWGSATPISTYPTSIRTPGDT